MYERASARMSRASLLVRRRANRGSWLLAPLALAAIALTAVGSASSGYADADPYAKRAASVSSSLSSAPVNGRIAFAMRSDLFTVQPNGGGLRRLTSGAGFDDGPAWSPNGRWIAFSRTLPNTKLTSVYVVRETGGTPRLLVRGARSPSWSPTGRRLAVLRAGASCRRSCPLARGVWTVRFAGGKPQLASGTAWSADWSRSGRELAVMGADGLGLVSVASGAVRHLSDVSGATGTPLDWSPDNSRLLFVAENGVVIVSIADGSVRTLVPRAAMAESPPCSGSFGPARWSPDGRWIAYEELRCVSEGVAEPFIRSSIPIINANGVFHHEIDNMIWGTTSDFGLTDFVWSPDSRFLAFIDDAELSAGEHYLERASASPSGSYKRLKAGARGVPSWQRLPP